MGQTYLGAGLLRGNAAGTEQGGRVQAVYRRALQGMQEGGAQVGGLGGPWPTH